MDAGQGSSCSMFAAEFPGTCVAEFGSLTMITTKTVLNLGVYSQHFTAGWHNVLQCNICNKNNVVLSWELPFPI